MYHNTTDVDPQTALINDPDFLKEMMGRFLQNFLEEEFSNSTGAERYQRTASRQGYRNGHYERQLKTRAGSIELLVPRDRDGRFRTELFERYQRSEKALVTALAEMYLHGVSTRKVTKIVEELCGHGISKSQVSSLVQGLDQDLEKWRTRRLDGDYAYVQLDAMYEKVREGGRVRSVANYIATGIRSTGVREVLGCYTATREHKSEWKEFIRGLKARGMNTPDLVASDHHEGLREAIVEELTGTLWQRCQVHYMRNFLGKLNKKDGSEMVSLLRSVLHASDHGSAKMAKEVLLDRLTERGLDNVAEWIEDTIDDALNVLNIPEIHRKRIRSTNMLERLNGEVRRRTRIIRIFPNRSSCLRMVTAICQEISESWEGRRYLNFEGLE